MILHTEFCNITSYHHVTGWSLIFLIIIREIEVLINVTNTYEYYEVLSIKYYNYVYVWK